MANKPVDKKCVDIRICADDEINTAVIKFQARKVAQTGLCNYTKPEAAADLYRELLRKQ